jgi:hypothetical protein
MEAVHTGIAQGRRRVGVVFILLLLALLASGAAGYFIRYATTPAPTGTVQTVQHAAVVPGDAVGDRWWQDAAPAAPAASAPVGDRWWEDSGVSAPSGAASDVRDDSRTRTY